MNVVGIVCEYNPFHLGHEYQLSESRKMLGEDSCIVCVMSGDFVQRGDAALMTKFARAEAACRCGADIVVELPLPWTLSSAEGFARGSVSLLRNLGADYISFGSEAGDTACLENVAQLLAKPGFIDAVKAYMRENPQLPFAAARQAVAAKELGEQAELLSEPNNILGIEYIKAIHELDLHLKSVTVKRYGNAHDSIGEGNIKSASEIRAIAQNGGAIDAYIPLPSAEIYERERSAGRVYADRGLFETALISRLRMFDENYFDLLPDALDGVGRRLYAAVHREASLEEICAAAKTKRTALARIRRMCICAALGITADMADGTPRYARLLAASARGCEHLRSVSFPVVTKPAHAKELDDASRRIFELSAAAHDLYTLGFASASERSPGADWRHGPKII